MPWIGQGGNRKATDGQIIDAYRELKSSVAVGAKFGVSAVAVCNRLRKLKVPRDGVIRIWTKEEVATMQDRYPAAAREGTVDALAKELRRTKPSVVHQAKVMGFGRLLTTASRPWLATDRRGAWRVRTSDEIAEQTRKIHETKMARYGTLVLNKGDGLSWKAGWREFGGKRHFYRSMWEANYGRYLEWLKVRGDIAEWEHEPQTFWFDKIKRGVRSYLPDFRVTERSGAVAYHEVKGWMDERSKTKIARMKRYHPTVKLIVIDSRQYKVIAAKVSQIVPYWETEARRSNQK